jgi:hypothetical protein
VAKWRAPVLLLLAFLVLVALFRIPSFSSHVFNADEAYLATEAQILRDGGHLYADAVDRKPPLVPYVYAAVGWVTGSDGIAPVRVAAVLADALTALLIAAEARRRFGRRGLAVIAGVLYVLAATALTPENAQAANFEVFMLPAMTAAFVLGARDRPGRAGACLGIATLAKQTAAATLVPLIWMVWRDRRGRIRNRGLLALGSAFVAPVVAVAVLVGLHDFVFWVVTGNGNYLNVDGALGYVLHAAWHESFLFLIGHLGLIALLPWAWKHRRQDADLWLWLGSAVLAVATGLRFFGHYYLQLLPPLCLLATRALATPRPLPRRAVVVAVTVAAFGSALGFYVPAITAQDSSDAEIALNVASYVRTHTHPGDRVLVWGHAPEVYWLSDRRPATRFLTTGFVTGASGGRPPNHVGEQLAAPGAWDDFLADLAAHPPALVIDMSQANQRHAGAYAPEHFPQFRRYLFNGRWREVAAVAGAGIYAPAA